VPAAPVSEEIAFHRRVVSLLKKEIAQVDRNASRQYIRRFTREFRGFSALSTWDDLIISCYKADLVYLGDYHALSSSQMFAARLLKEIASRSRHVILAVEMVYGRNQRALDQWLTGAIDEGEFKRKIRYDLEWGYDWEGFRAIFETARDYGLKVYGIDCPPRNGLRYIRKRDRYAAARIADIYAKHPTARVVVMIGESHLAEGHLPAAVREALAAVNLEKRSVRVLQNIEEIYWKLVAQGREHEDVVTLGNGTYCVFNASPIAKYESYRQTINRWREQEGEDAIDLTPTLHSMIDTILRFLGVDKYAHRVRQGDDGADLLVDLYPDVHASVDATHLRELLSGRRLSPALRSAVKERIARKGSCYIPRVNAILIGAFSLVQGGEEAAHFVNTALRGDVFRDARRARARPDLFYETVMQEALGFFGSKLIDPSRNHFFETKLYQYHRRDREFIEKNTEYSYEQYGRIIRFILMHKRFERAYRSHSKVPAELTEGIRTRSRREFSVLTHELGYYLGQQMYDGYHQGLIDRGAIRELYFRRFAKPGSALSAYLDLVATLPATVPT